MTANPDSALRQALVALGPLAKLAAEYDDDNFPDEWRPARSIPITVGDLRRAREAHALITEALQQHKGGEGMIFTDWLFHKYIRKGERIKLIRNAAASYATVKDILGFGKYAPVMLEPTGAIRRDGIQRGPDGEWTYNYDESSGE